MLGQGYYGNNNGARSVCAAVVPRCAAEESVMTSDIRGAKRKGELTQRHLQQRRQQPSRLQRKKKQRTRTNGTAVGRGWYTESRGVGWRGTMLV